MQRDAALAIPLHACDFGASEPARAINADAAGAEPHRRLYSALHGPPERYPTFQLLRDGFGDQLRIELRFPDFHDIDDDVGFRELRHLAPKLLDVRALLSDHDPRAR
jgi:hypothetical protein